MTRNSYTQITVSGMPTADVSIKVPDAEAIPTYEVTYRVVNGTWSDGGTADKTETVQSGSRPASVPDGMKAAEGYEGGAWDTDPAAATITGATTFTYTFTKKDVAVPDASVTAHVRRIGWMDPVTDGTAAGTTGKSRRMEALTLRLPDGVSGGIEYRGHIQRSGWEKDWKADGAESGTTGKSRRVEAVQIQLTGEAADAYDVYYRVHVQKFGWMAWAKNGEEAGTQGMSRRAEAIQVVLVAKDAPAPDATY
ncbi:MAG: hypothetical protein Q4A01_05075 [Coriobacteriales bacterium]|nr:hypothetical protein [Coriobacteriales bacterium]